MSMNKLEFHFDTPEKKRTIGVDIQKVAKFAGSVALGLFLMFKTGDAIKEQFKAPVFSDKEIGVKIEPGQGLDHAVYQIDGVGTEVNPLEAREYVENMPENKEVLKDGIQANETIFIPVKTE